MMDAGGKKWEAEICGTDAASSSRRSSINGNNAPLISYPDSEAEIERLPGDVWYEAKIQVAKLLDDRVPPAKKEQIATQLVQLFEFLERKHSRAPPPPAPPPPPPPSSQFQRSSALIISKNQISGPVASDFNDRLRNKIQEFNDGLAHLGNKILTLKSKLLMWNQKPIKPEVSEVQVCCNVHRNFRRILQKESRYLRDELYAAQAVIRRLKDEKSTSLNLVPYSSLHCKPIDFINIESGLPPMWSITPANRFNSGKLINLQHASLKGPSTLEALPAPTLSNPLKFLCSSENTSDVAIPSRAHNEPWIPPPYIRQIKTLQTNDTQSNDRIRNTVREETIKITSKNV